MRRGRHLRPRGNLTVVGTLFLGFLALGIALICWALTGIGSQSVSSADTSRGLSSSPTTAAVKPMVGQAASDQPSDTPEPLYARRPAQGDQIGSLLIPVLAQELPIIEGTRTEDLKRGVGHYTRSVLPGEKDNCVLSGHRDTIFRRLGKVKEGDLLVAQTSAGTFTYEVKRIRIVEKDDRTVIVPTDNAVLTVTTCYPFNYVGSAPKRYILSADLVTPQQAPRFAE